MQVLPLHEHPEFMLETCHLINEEWKRSETARLRSLESSCENLPTCLILLQNNKVIGHAKLSVLPSIKNSCFIESVVISKHLRNKGYGRYLMKEAEEFCRNKLHLNSIYLSTKGQENFYSKLGYVECQPISIYGCPLSQEFENMKLNKQTKVPELIANNHPIPPPLPKNSNTTIVNKKTYMCKYL